MSKQEQPQYDLNEKFYIFDNFITSNKHILERGDEEWDSSKIFFQLSIEHADNSPLTYGAEKYEKDGNLDWDYIKDVNRDEKIYIAPIENMITPFDFYPDDLFYTDEGNIFALEPGSQGAVMYDTKDFEIIANIENINLYYNILQNDDTIIIANTKFITTYDSRTLNKVKNISIKVKGIVKHDKNILVWNNKNIQILNNNLQVITIKSMKIKNAISLSDNIFAWDKTNIYILNNSLEIIKTHEMKIESAIKYSEYIVVKKGKKLSLINLNLEIQKEIKLKKKIENLHLLGENLLVINNKYTLLNKKMEIIKSIDKLALDYEEISFFDNNLAIHGSHTDIEVFNSNLDYIGVLEGHDNPVIKVVDAGKYLASFCIPSLSEDVGFDYRVIFWNKEKMTNISKITEPTRRDFTKLNEQSLLYINGDCLLEFNTKTIKSRVVEQFLDTVIEIYILEIGVIAYDSYELHIYNFNLEKLVAVDIFEIEIYNIINIDEENILIHTYETEECESEGLVFNIINDSLIKVEDFKSYMGSLFFSSNELLNKLELNLVDKSNYPQIDYIQENHDVYTTSLFKNRLVTSNLEGDIVYIWNNEKEDVLFNVRENSTANSWLVIHEIIVSNDNLYILTKNKSDNYFLYDFSNLKPRGIDISNTKECIKYSTEIIDIKQGVESGDSFLFYIGSTVYKYSASKLTKWYSNSKIRDLFEFENCWIVNDKRLRIIRKTC